MSVNNKYKLHIVILHIVLIILAYTSPIWLDWKLITLGVVINFIQILIAGGCVLSIAQFNNKDQTFHEWYLNKIGIKVNRQRFNMFVRYIVPFIILSAALIFQLVFSHRILLNI